MRHVLALLAAGLTVALVSVVAAVVIVPDHDELSGNVITTTGGTVAVDTPFTLTVDGAANSDATTTALATLTVPGDCTVEEGPQIIAAPVGQSTFQTSWTVECSGVGPHSLTSTITLIPVLHIEDPDDTNDSLTTVVNVE